MLHRFVFALGLLGGCFLPEEDPEDLPSVCGDGARTGGEECDDENLEDGDACSSTCKRVEQYTVHWRTSSVSGAVHSCPAGFDLADVIMVPVAATSDCYPSLSRSCPFDVTGAEIVHTAECIDGAANVQVPPRLLRDGYQVSVRFVSSTTGEVYGQTLPQWMTEVTETTLHIESGFARIKWDLRSPTGDPLDCAGANTAYITARLTHADLLPITMMLACPELTMLSPPLLEGTWNLELTARQDVTRISIPIAPRSALSDPGPIVITMTDTGL